METPVYFGSSQKGRQRFQNTPRNTLCSFERVTQTADIPYGTGTYVN